MKCAQARRLFGAYWDDDTTQAEREWLESHFVSCVGCRREYDEWSRALELAGSLPRVEPAPDLLERTLARTRRATSVPDVIPNGGVQWVPVTAAAAVLLVLATIVSPWVGFRPTSRVAKGTSETVALREAEPVAPARSAAPGTVVTTPAPVPSATRVSDDRLAAGSDSLFDHAEDVEFILDPVTLRRGRATVRQSTPGVQAEQAVITF